VRNSALCVISHTLNTEVLAAKGIVIVNLTARAVASVSLGYLFSRAHGAEECAAEELLHQGRAALAFTCCERFSKNRHFHFAYLNILIFWTSFTSSHPAFELNERLERIKSVLETRDA